MFIIFAATHEPVRRCTDHRIVGQVVLTTNISDHPKGDDEDSQHMKLIEKTVQISHLNDSLQPHQMAGT